MNNRYVFAAIAVILAIMAGYMGVIPLLGGRIQTYYTLSLTKYGTMLSIGSLPSAVAALLAGHFVDRWGSEKLLAISVAGVGLAFTLAAFGWSWGVMLLAIVLAASFGSAISLALQTRLVELFRDERRKILSAQLASYSVANMLMPLWAEGLLEVSSGDNPTIGFNHALHIPFAILALVLIGAAIWLTTQRSKPARAQERDDSGKIKKKIPMRSVMGGGVVWLMAMLVLHGTADNASHVWMTRVWGSGEFAASPLRAGIVLSAYSAAYALGRILLGVLPENFGRRSMLVVPGILGGSVFILGLLSGSPTGMAIGYVLGAAIWSVELPVAVAIIAAHTPTHLGRLLALSVALGSVSSFGVISLMGFLGEGFGDAALWQILLIPASIFPLVGLAGACWLFFSSNKRAQNTQTEPIQVP